MHPISVFSFDYATKEEVGKEIVPVTIIKRDKAFFSEINPIEDGLFWGYSCTKRRGGVARSPLLSWHSYTLPKDPKII